MDIKTAWRYVLIAQGEPEKNPFNYGQFIPLVNKRDYAYIFDNYGQVIIAFCGSKNEKAWINNFEVSEYDDVHPEIHSGFYESWKEYEHQILNFLENNRYNVTCIGFSRGGALSTLAAFFIRQELQLVVKNITFGSPRVGNSDFVKQYTELDIPTIRVVNGWDIVTELPPDTAGFVHVGVLYRLPQPLWHRWFYRIRDHYPENYNKAIEKL